LSARLPLRRSCSHEGRRELDALEGRGTLPRTFLEELVARYGGQMLSGATIVGLIPVGREELLVVSSAHAALWITGFGTTRQRYLRVWHPTDLPHDPYLVWGFAD
jgi:hypothetical protein